jgi:hypothetical protein
MTADIRYRELNGRDAAFDIRCVSAVKISNSSHRLILPGGHTIPLKIILNNCCTVLSKYHVFFFIAKVIALR